MNERMKKERKKAAVYVIECLGNARKWNKEKNKQEMTNESAYKDENGGGGC